MPIVRGTLASAVLVLAAACGGGDGGVVNPPPEVTLGSIVPSVTTISVAAGQRQTIAVTARDASNGIITSASGYSFSSSAPAVAVVSTSGQVTGVSAGSATVTVSLTLVGVTKTASVAVTVTGTLPASVTVAAGAASNDFQPDFVAVARTGTVTWTFGGRAHNAEFSGTAGAPANIPVTTNASLARTFGTSGTFSYTCTLHPNMNGTVLVP